MLDKKNRFVSQTIQVICATCGEITKICNRDDSAVFTLEDSELMFNCPECHNSYDVPYTKR